MTTTTNHIPLSATEIGNIWTTYINKTMLLRFLEHFLEHVDNLESRKIILSTYESSTQAVITIKNMMEKENAVIPMGFTEHDVFKDTPKLFDYKFDIMFLQMMSKVEATLFALYSCMAYRKDVRKFYKDLTTEALDGYDKCTENLLEAGVLVRPPYASVPKEIDFVDNDNYLEGIGLFGLGDKRSLNTIEVSFIHHSIETNLVGMQLMIGFAQVAKDKEVKKYFADGMDLAKKFETTLGEFFRQDYIEPPGTHAGKATNSTTAPFSDKIMMYLTSLLSTFRLGGNALSGAFSLRSDITMNMIMLIQNTFSFAQEGAKIMIKNRWMEKPPQIEDRKQLADLKK